MSGKRIGLLVAGIVLALIILSLAWTLFLKPVYPADMRLQTLDGREISSEGLLRGKMTFLNFWATWCGPCIREMPMLDSLYALMDTSRWQMFLISEEPSELIRTFAEKKPFTIPYLKHDGPLADIGVAALPKTLVLDVHGKIVYTKTGGFSETTASLYAKMGALEKKGAGSLVE